MAVGASMGGYCALALARQAPERVLGIVLAGSRASPDTPDRRRTRDETIARLRTEGVPDDLETEVGAEELAVAQEAMRDRPDATGVIAAFGGPMLVCAGEEDDVVPLEEARSLAESALLGTLEVFPGAGHLLSLDQPERFTAVLLEYLDRWS